MDLVHSRFELTQFLIGSFRSRQHAGRPRSADHAKQDWLNVALGHWPVGLKVKRDCVCLFQVPTCTPHNSGPGFP